jgi:hypothetical protein
MKREKIGHSGKGTGVVTGTYLQNELGVLMPKTTKGLVQLLVSNFLLVKVGRRQCLLQVQEVDLLLDVADVGLSAGWRTSGKRRQKKKGNDQKALNHLKNQ